MQHLVAVEGGLRSTEERLAVLARITGFSRVEATTRLRLLETRPGVIASFADETVAQAMAHQLRASGFGAYSITGDPRESRAQVQTFEAGPEVLRVECGEDGTLEVPMCEVGMLLHGLRLFPPRGLPPTLGRARGAGLGQFGSARGWVGREEQFVHVYAPGMPALVFAEAGLRFASDPSTLEPTRAGNFARVVATLRMHCTRATYDSRLLTRGGQKSILGPTLRPETHLDVAISLLAKPYRLSSPYR